ncbi:PIN domain-containing protein [Leuconostoc lactis]|uniref:PIN domain-containing protein n=1 Tax=Leuconostoc lactis TaxID=1246 RepID=UPI00289D3202|nr:PIN domain-containing protein [Leuconostoc lactis]
MIDTNILYRVLPIEGYEPPSDRFNEKILEFIKEIGLRHLNLIITSSVISEYLNLYLRKYFYKHISDYRNSQSNEIPDFKKDFKNNPKSDYLEKLSDARDFLFDFLYESNSFSVSERELTGIHEPVKEVLNLMSSFNLDYTDALLLLLAKQESAAIFTVDHDFLANDYPFDLTIYTFYD